MTKTRQPMTAEWAMQSAIQALPLPTIASFIKASPDLTYKYSNEDEPNKISVERALLVDTLCKQTHGFTPFLTLFLANADIAGAPPTRTVGEHMLAASVMMGRASSAVLAALSPESEKGKKISSNERTAILMEIESLRREADAIERAVIAASRDGAP